MKQGVFDFETMLQQSEEVQPVESGETVVPDASDPQGDPTNDAPSDPLADSLADTPAPPAEAENGPLPSVLTALSKLDAVKVERVSRLDQIDQEFCDQQNRRFQETKALFAEVKERLEALQAEDKDNSYVSYQDTNHFHFRLRDLPGEHIRKVVRHFEHRHQVALDEERIVGELQDEEPTIERIVDKIFEQLGGASFQELAVKQIKANLQKKIWKAPEIKGARLFIDRFVYSEKGFNGEPRLTWNSREDVLALLTALQHFETGDTQILYPFTNVVEATVGSWAYGPFDRHEVDCEKVKAIKFYQNGKAEITFAGHTEAAQFAAEYARPRERR